jgi:hypothetical protein
MDNFAGYIQRSNLNDIHNYCFMLLQSPFMSLSTETISLASRELFDDLLGT